jgi:hypothetical protein
MHNLIAGKVKKMLILQSALSHEEQNTGMESYGSCN